MAKDSAFYERMLEAKKLKKIKLEQEQLLAEFSVYPERFTIPIKTEAEQKLDAAFEQVKLKLHAANPTQHAKLEQAFMEIERKAQGM